MTETLSVILTGAAGKMGKEAVRAIHAAPNLTLTGALTRSSGLGQDAGSIAGIAPLGLPLSDALSPLLENLTGPAVLVDLTRGEPAYEHATAALKLKIPVVIGATGMTPEQIEDLTRLSAEQACGVLIAPNFSIGALLMMNFAAQAARYFNWVEIIELHHEKKADAPSGTALKTAAMIAAASAEAHQTLQSASPEFTARGEQIHGIPVHSVRLPGLLAHQEVIFGDTGQTLTLRHDSIDRSCFMPGLLLAIDKVRSLDSLVYGLEKLL